MGEPVVRVAEIIGENYTLAMVDVNAFEDDPNNDRDHEDQHIDRLVNEIQEFGIVESVVINVRNGYYISGHGRREAARLAHKTRIPAILVDVDDATHEQLSIALNGPYGRRNEQKTRERLVRLERRGVDLHNTGLPEGFVNRLLARPPVTPWKTPERFEVVVECKSAAEKDALVSELRSRGFQFRLARG